MKIDRTWLQELRLSKDKTHQEVAEEAGIERAYYTMIENGTRSPSPAVAKRIAASLEFDWTIFFADECSETLLIKDVSCVEQSTNKSTVATGTDG